MAAAAPWTGCWWMPWSSTFEPAGERPPMEPRPALASHQRHLGQGARRPALRVNSIWSAGVQAFAVANFGILIGLRMSER